MSDKANVEITSPHDGIVQELLWNVGDMAQVFEPLLTIQLEGGHDSDSQQLEDVIPKTKQLTYHQRKQT
eukprot:UN24765